MSSVDEASVNERHITVSNKKSGTEKDDACKTEETELVFDGVFDDLEIDDLYSDLKIDSLNEMNYTELKDKFDHSLNEVRNLKLENGSLKRENEILKKNITSLYLTAKREIQRKDNEIKLLNDQLMKRKLHANKRRMFNNKRLSSSTSQVENIKTDNYDSKISQLKDEIYQSRKRKRSEKADKARLQPKYENDKKKASKAKQ